MSMMPMMPPVNPRQAMNDAAFGTMDAMLDGKIPQAEVNYGPAVEPMQSCGACVNFRPPESCSVVAGKVSPDGVSDAFAGEEEMPPAEEMQ